MKRTTIYRMLGATAAWAAVVLAAFIPVGRIRAQGDYTAARNAVVNAAGARVIRIEAGAGFLHVNGRAGIKDVKVTGVARASSQRVLDEIKLQAERQGDVVLIKMITPDQSSSFWDLFRGGYQQQLDLTIDVPLVTPLDIDDGSGDLWVKGTGPVTLEDGSGNLEVSGITGNVRINDGSGNMVITGVQGDVTVTDGSGEIRAENVTGNFTIEDDGSGGVDVNGIGGTMRIEDKGSGGVRVSRVGGDFIVASKGSGGIDYDTVKGRVDIPERRGRYR